MIHLQNFNWSDTCLLQDHNSNQQLTPNYATYFNTNDTNRQILVQRVKVTYLQTKGIEDALAKLRFGKMSKILKSLLLFLVSIFEQFQAVIPAKPASPFVSRTSRSSSCIRAIKYQQMTNKKSNIKLYFNSFSLQRSNPGISVILSF